MSRTQPLLVIGGTRGTGLLVALHAARRGAAVRVLARDAARAARRLDPSIEIVQGDITRRDTLLAGVSGACTIVLTAGCRSGRPAREATVRATEFEGVRNVLDAAKESGFRGRLLYMTASAVARRSFSTLALNLYKGNTLLWRRRAEDEIRRSGLDYTIIRAGFLLNAEGGRRGILLTQEPLPSIWHPIAREDLAEAFLAAAEHPNASHATFDVAWSRQPREPWEMLFEGLEPDMESRGDHRFGA